MTREQALTAYTAGGAYAEGQDQRKGRIAPGLAADLAVLSQDVLTIPTPQLPATTSLLTLVDGEVIFEDALWTSRPLVRMSAPGKRRNSGRPAHVSLASKADDLFLSVHAQTCPKNWFACAHKRNFNTWLRQFSPTGKSRQNASSALARNFPLSASGKSAA